MMLIAILIIIIVVIIIIIRTNMRSRQRRKRLFLQFKGCRSGWLNTQHRTLTEKRKPTDDQITVFLCH